MHHALQPFASRLCDPYSLGLGCGPCAPRLQQYISIPIHVQVWHKSSGYVTLILSIATITLGTQIIPVDNDNYRASTCSIAHGALHMNRQQHTQQAAGSRQQAALHMQHACAACMCSMHMQHAHAACTCSMHMHVHRHRLRHMHLSHFSELVSKLLVPVLVPVERLSC